MPPFDSPPHHHHHQQSAPGTPPNVWLQLLEKLFEASTCNPAVTGTTLKLVKEHEQYTERLAAQERQIAELQQRVVQQEQQNAQRQRQIAALQQQVASMPALSQAQVQQLLQLLPSQPK